MLDEASSILDRDRRDRRPQRLDQRLAGARLRLAQKALYLRERLLDGVVVRRVGWQEEQLAAPRLDQLAHLLALVRREVVRNYDLPGAKRGAPEPARRKPRRPPSWCLRPPPSTALSPRSSCSPRASCSCRGCAAPTNAPAPRAATRLGGAPARCSHPFRLRRPGARRRFPVSPATSARQAALSHSSRSLAPTVLFFGSIPSA